MKKNNFLKNNWFFFTMILGIVAGCLLGAFWKDAAVLKPLGDVFINLMFCVVVPMVFFSISGDTNVLLLITFPLNIRSYALDKYVSYSKWLRHEFIIYKILLDSGYEFIALSPYSLNHI